MQDMTFSRQLYVIIVFLTLHDCEIYYLSAVNYDSVTSDLIFIRGPLFAQVLGGRGRPIANFLTCSFYEDRYVHHDLPLRINRVHYLSRGVGGGGQG